MSIDQFKQPTKSQKQNQDTRYILEMLNCSHTLIHRAIKTIKELEESKLDNDKHSLIASLYIAYILRNLSSVLAEAQNYGIGSQNINKEAKEIFVASSKIQVATNLMEKAILEKNPEKLKYAVSDLMFSAINIFLYAYNDEDFSDIFDGLW